MDKSPLVSEQIEAGNHLILELSKRMSIQAAFWLRERESDEWFLYIASDQINDANVGIAYREVLRIIPPQKNLWIDPFQVKAIGIDSPLGKAALDVSRKFPASVPTRFHGPRFGNLSVDEVCIYPIPHPASA